MPSTVTKAVSFSLFRVLLPIVLLGGWLFRYNAFSLLYLLFLVLSPLCCIPDVKSMSGCTGYYLKALLGVSLMTTLAQAVFQLMIVGLGKDSDIVADLSNCTYEESVLRQIGLQRLDNVYPMSVVMKVLPDIVVLLVTTITFAVCFCRIKRDRAHDDQLPSSKSPSLQAPSRRHFLTRLGSASADFALVLFIVLAAIVVPSALSAVYFVVFLFVATWWALNRNGGRCYGYGKVVLLTYAIAHLVLLYLYQLQFFQDAVPHLEFTARLTGLTGIMKNDCTLPDRFLVWYDGAVPWNFYLNVGVILTLIWILGLHVRNWYYGQDRYTLLQDDHQSTATRSRHRSHDSEKQVLAEEDAETPVDESLVRAGDAAANYNSIDQDGAPAADLDTPDGIETTRLVREQQPSKSFGSVILDYGLKQSFLLALIAMMAWSITFISWLTFVFLIIACLIWITPKSRCICYALSPLLVFYAECLLIGQFIYSFNLSTDELPEMISGYNIREIGFKKFTYPCFELGIQIIYTTMLWLTLHQFMIQRTPPPPSSDPALPLETMNEGSQTSLAPTFALVFRGLHRPPVDNYPAVLGHYIKKLMCKYWIFICCGMTLLISINSVVIYRLIYMALFLYFILVFQVWNWFWRKTMYVFWWVVIVYSMVVLVTLYTYQFSVIRDFWTNGTEWSDDTLLDIGLEQFDSAGLFVKLLTPTSFIIIIIIQVHYFHADFMRLSDVDRFRKELPATDDVAEETMDEGAETTPKSEEPTNSFKQLMLLVQQIVDKCEYYWTQVSQVLWSLLAIHMFKLAMFTIFIVCCTEVSAVSALYIILIGIFLPIWRLYPLLSHLAQFWTAIVLLAKMAYQLRMVETDQWKTNCTDNSSNSSSLDPYPFNHTIDNAEYVGLVKVNDVSHYIRNYLAIMLILVLEAIVKLHETQKYNDPQKERPHEGITFPQVTRKEADHGMLCCIKYLINYVFYKFGLEICYVMLAITICVRVDAFAVLYAIVLGVLLCLSRRGNAYVWPVLVILLAILLPVQYISVVGLPLGACIQYPWVTSLKFSQNLESWLYLPDYINPPNPYILLADFFLFLAVVRQAWVFMTEMGEEVATYGGGDNKSILPEVEANTMILVPDFTVRDRTFLDGLKYFIFCYMFWVTMVIMFVSGTSRINLFSMGYLIAVFIFMWYGQEFLLKPLRTLLRMWNGLIGYCFAVLFAKAALQLIGCVYIGVLFEHACPLVQLLGITCLKPHPSFAPSTISDKCNVPSDSTGLAWDVVCFTFLLLQRRIYMSNYFRHIVTDLLAQNRLASRGAVLINRILIMQSRKLQQDEEKVLEGIKHKMILIKEKQAKIKKGFKEPEDHFQVIRGGDYYMFENVDEDSTPEDEADPNTITLGTNPSDEQADPMKLIVTAVESGAKKAVDQVETPDEDSYATAPAVTHSELTSPECESDTDKTILIKTEDKEPQSTTIFDKIKTWLRFSKKLFLTFIDWLIDVFNRISRNYRYVAHKLQKDKEQEKARIKAEQKRVFTVEPKDEEAGPSGDHSDGDDLVEVKVEVVAACTSIALTRCESVDSLDHFTEESEDRPKKSRTYRFIESIYFLLVSQSAALCYFLMILCPIIYGTIISLPYPALVFLWAMLSVPRPSKFFWLTIILYTEIIVVIKYMFQFEFFPWNSDTLVNTDPYWPPRLLGIEQKDDYANVDIALLLFLFIHRSLLKRYGLWRDAHGLSQGVDDAECGDETECKQPSITSAEDGQPSIEAGEFEASVGPSGDASSKCHDKKTKKKATSCFAPFTIFYQQMTDPTFRATTDVYTLMLLCDVINFLILIFGYSSFGPATSSSSNVSSYISDNRIPVPFLILLLSQFFMIIIDRGLYLKKYVFGKFIYQIILVVLIHIVLFFILPKVTMRDFIHNTAAQLFYFIKCVYFCLSAYQIRSGYPTRILGNFLTKKYNYLNLFLFQGFLAVPFILEIRALMDWMWTDTTLSMGGWLLMEDIYANIFILKCWRNAEEKYPTPRGNKKRALIKYVSGGLLLLLIIFIIWFPLVLFSFLNTVYIANPPVECRVKMALSGYDPIFSYNAQQDVINGLSQPEYNDFMRKHGKDRDIVAFINLYKPEDIRLIKIKGQSTEVWGISPPSLEKLQESLNSTQGMRLEVSVSFNRENVTGAVSETISNTFYSQLGANAKAELLSVLSNVSASNTQRVLLKNMYPPYLRLRKSGKVEALNVFDNSRKAIVARLERGTTPGLTGSTQWWEISDPNNEDIVLVTFNDRVAPSSVSMIAGYGIIGLYVSLVFVLGRFFRSILKQDHSKVMYTQLPMVDNILQLCLDIYLVRENLEYHLEEDLFAKLIFLYRMPDMLFKWTKLTACKKKVQ